MSTIHLVADYGDAGDLAFAEVEGVLRRTVHSPVAVNRQPVEKFSPIHASFCATQLAIHAKSDELVFVNVDARDHTTARITNGEGAPFFVGVLRNGVRIVGPGLATFTVAQHLGILHSLAEIDTSAFVAEGRPGQFRSRDVYPPIIAAIVRGDQLKVTAVLRELVPWLEYCILSIDGYGNIKTLIRKSTFAEFSTIRVAIGAKIRELPVTHGLFDAVEGELHCYPGSSGLPEDPFMEIGVRKESAAEALGNPTIGTPITIFDTSVAATPSSR